jgi:predicted nuclease of predicted toxin-antitoxin system
VADCGLEKVPDKEIRAHAVNTAAVIVTKDEDFECTGFCMKVQQLCGSALGILVA